MAFLATLTDVTLVHEHEDVRPVECQEIAPNIRDSIRPDGNCLYRAISKQVTGSQDNHMALRLAMIQFMLHDEHAVAVARLMNVKFRGDVLDDHERKRRAVAALQGYIRKHGVDRPSTWGTEKEIRVIATMLQLEIFTFSGSSKGQRRWVHFLQCLLSTLHTPTFSTHVLPCKLLDLHMHTFTQCTHSYHAWAIMHLTCTWYGLH